MAGWTMSEPPVSWTVAQLSNVGTWGSGGTPSRSNAKNFLGDIPWAVIGDLNDKTLHSTQQQISNIGLNTSSAKLVPAQALLVAMYGSIGKLSITGIECATNQAIAFCIPDEELIDLKYLFYALRHSRTKLVELGQGAGQQNISQTILKRFEIPVAPLKEQKRIAQKLHALLAQVDTLKARIDAIPALLKRFRHATLSAAANGDLTKDWREVIQGTQDRESANQYLARILEARSLRPRTKFKPPVAPDTDTRSTEVPNTWVVSSVSSFAECLDSMRVPVKKELRAREGGIYPYFGANGEVDRVNEFLFDDDLVLVTEDETFYGRVKPIAYKYSGKCWVNNHVHVLRAHDKVGQSFLCYILMHYDVTPWLTGTTGRAKLTQGALMALPIGVPPPDEQAEIVRRIEKLFAFADQLEARVSAARVRIDALTQSLLGKAFRGELVPQDPDDEPASVLLERIRAQRAAAPKPKRGRKATVN